MAIAAEHLEQLFEQVTELLRPKPGETLLELWSWWRETPAARALERLDCIESRWKHWVLPALGQVRAGELTAELVDRMLERAALAGKSAQTCNHVLTDLRRVIDAARANNRWPNSNPCDYVRRRTRQPVERELLTKEEARLLLERTKGKYRPIFAVVLYLGLRKGEILGLLRCNVDLEHLVLHVRRSHGRESTKNGRWRSLPIHAELAPILREWLERSSGDVVFPGKSKGGRMSADANFTKRLRHALKKIGICKERIRYHDLRHTFSTLADDEAGIREEVVAQVLGHSPSLTARYTKRRVEKLREELARFTLKHPAQ